MGRKVLLAFDFNNVVFSSYFKDDRVNSKGIVTTAIKLFFIKINSMIQMFNPDMIVFASDLSRAKTFRRQMYPAYKATRRPMDEMIITQLKYIEQLVDLLGFPRLNNELYEADDILGMMSRLAEEKDYDTIIVSGDRDLYQLITDHVFVISPKGNELIDKDYLYHKYQLTPEQWIDLKILQGDKSDNIPGIRNIGEITALKLMQTYGSINNIYNHLDELNWKLRDILIAGEECIPLTRELVTVITDYNKINLTWDKLKRDEIYVKETFEVLRELELFSIMNIIKYNLIERS